MKIVAIDNGYYATKVEVERNCFSIKSKYTQDNDGDFEYKGKKYSFGHGTYNIDHNKTENDLHRLMTYYVLSRLTQSQEEFKLIVSLPMLHYKTHKEDFREYLMNEKLITTRLKDENKTFKITDCTVFLQGAGALYAYNPGEYKNKLIGLLDIGGLTAQGAVFEDLKPIKETMFTIDAGGIILNNKIKTRLNEKYGLNIQDYEVPYLTGYEDDISEILDEHFSEIKLEMKKKNWSIETLPILATGGSSIMAHRYLPKCTVTTNPIYDHVKGLGNIGRMIYR